MLILGQVKCSLIGRMVSLDPVCPKSSALCFSSRFAAAISWEREVTTQKGPWLGARIRSGPFDAYCKCGFSLKCVVIGSLSKTQQQMSSLRFGNFI